MGCHDEAAGAWRASHHDLAMQPATDETVLGDFADATFTYFGRTTRFSRDGDRFLVNTEGADGAEQEFEVRYTFGVTPLQQYLVAYRGERLQALSIAWDSRPAENGGQHWFHLYPDEDIAPGDPLHWTSAVQTWNFQCAACHSTNLRKHYDLGRDTYATTWSDLDVSCEACHGPGSRHVAWAESADRGADVPVVGLPVDLRRRGVWRFEEGATIAHLDSAGTDAQVATCAPCHSRRQLIDENPDPSRALLDQIRPALLDEPLYHADGQIRDEVYVYGSFIQSRMYSQGVTCSDCHDPHTLRVKGEGNALCATCHRSGTYDTPAHHFHQAGSAGARCVECHMPRTTYMVVDPRRDHSLRIPRPDLSVEYGTPNACTQCHVDRSNEWAADAVQRWFDDTSGPPAFAALLARGRDGTAAGDQALMALVGDTVVPGIVRATAIGLLGRRRAPAAAEAVERGSRDPDPLVRFGAARAGDALAPSERLRLLLPALQDSLLAVRLEATRVLASVPPEQMPPGAAPLIDASVDAYIGAVMVNADRPEAHLSVAVVQMDRGRLDAADASLQTALRLDSTFIPGYVNLSELRRLQGRDEEGEAILGTALQRVPGDASALHALGLLLVRQRRYAEAVEALRRAAQTRPEDARFSYVYAIALNSTGAVDQALTVLHDALDRHPNDVDMLVAVASISQDRGDIPGAIRAGRRLVDLRPDNPTFQQYLQTLLDRERQ